MSVTSQGNLELRARESFVNIIQPLESLGKLDPQGIETIFQLHPDAILKGYSLKFEQQRWHLRNISHTLRSADTASELIAWLALPDMHAVATA